MSVERDNRLVSVISAARLPKRRFIVKKGEVGVGGGSGWVFRRIWWWRGSFFTRRQCHQIVRCQMSPCRSLLAMLGETGVCAIHCAATSRPRIELTGANYPPETSLPHPLFVSPLIPSLANTPITSFGATPTPRLSSLSRQTGVSSHLYNPPSPFPFSILYRKNQLSYRKNRFIICRKTDECVDRGLFIGRKSSQTIWHCTIGRNSYIINVDWFM